MLRYFASLGACYHGNCGEVSRDMKAAIWSAILSVFLCAWSFKDGAAALYCPQTERGTLYLGSEPVVDADEIISVKGPLLAGGKLYCKVSYSVNAGANRRYRIEEGTYKGVRYRIYYTDASGSIQGLSTNTLDYVGDKYGSNWSTRCELDQVDDTRYCFLTKENLSIGIWKNGTYFAAIGYDHYPGSQITIRVDKNKPITANADTRFSRTQTLEIIKQLKIGSKVVTRYKEWPYKKNKDEAFGIYGFGQAWEILHKLYEAIEP